MIYQDEQKHDLCNCRVAMKVKEHTTIITIPISIITSIFLDHNWNYNLHKKGVVFRKLACHALPITSITLIVL